MVPEVVIEPAVTELVDVSKYSLIHNPTTHSAVLIENYSHIRILQPHPHFKRGIILPKIQG